MLGDENWSVYSDLCDIQEIVIPGGGGQDMKVMVYRSLQNKDKKNLAAMVHIHAGGVFGSPLKNKHHLSRIASKTDIVFFSIDYR